ncbi:ABC transporter permease [Streptomyces sp. SID11233]|nr:ABC transporter permease [Streptomyces sp. SID11233]
MPAQSPVGVPGGQSSLRFRNLGESMSGRSVRLVLGVLVLQTAFVLSCVGAFRAPVPHRIPLGVAAPTTPIADDTFYLLALLPGEPVDPLRVADEAAAVDRIHSRQVDGALVLSRSGTVDLLLVASGAGPLLAKELATHVSAAERRQGRTVRVRDVVPIAAGDKRLLSSFSLVVGWCAGGILCASVQASGAGRRRLAGPRASVAMGVLLVYSVLAGLLGVLVARTLLDAVPGNFCALWALGSVLVLTVGALTLALYELAGALGIGLALLLVVVLGVPSAGGVYPTESLPPFWRAVGPSLPPGAGLDAVESIAYFRGAGAGGPLWTLLAWAGGGAAVVLLGGVLVSRSRPPAARATRRP